jgi:ABC-type uncharacterized transport system substrate-binding protein
MERRALLTFFGAALALRPSSVGAQHLTSARTVVVLMGVANDEETKARTAAIEKGLADRGWFVGRNLHIEYRFAEGEDERLLSLAKGIVELRPDVIIAHSTPVVAALHQVTRTLPIVFVVVGDPIGSGFVTSIAHPGGNITGFTVMQPTIIGKYLSILRQLNPKVIRVAVMYNPESTPSTGMLSMHSFSKAAQEFHLTPIMASVRTPAEIENSMTGLGAALNAGLIVMPGNFTTLYRELIISLAARLRIPTLYPYRYFAEEGGLLSYGVDVLDLFRRAPDYVDRILRGANPADLPVQAPRKFELVINLKTARALDIIVPRILLAGADALIN